MGSKRMISVLIFGAVFIALVFSVFFLWTQSHREIKEFPIPSISPTQPHSEDNGTNAAEEGGRVVVTKDTVQNVISTLRRPQVYSRDLVIKSLWNGGSVVYNIKSSFSENASAFEINGGEDTQRIIITDSAYYVWYQGDYEPFSASIREQPDRFHMLITYEDIVNLPIESILEADYTTFEGELCVYVKYSAGSLGYTTICYVSTKNGLLIAAEEYDGDMLTYKMTSLPCSEGEINEKLFVMPDGKSVLEP